MRFPGVLMVLALLSFPSCGTVDGNKAPKVRDPVSYSGAICDSLVEGKRVIQGQLVLENSYGGGNSSMLKITDRKGVTTEASWPEWAKNSSWIIPGKTYQVELMTRIYKGPFYVFNDVLRVLDEGHVRLDESVCHVHHLPMQRQLEDGKSAEAYPDSFTATRNKRFPNDGNVYLACGSGIRHPLWKCPECEKAYHRWTKRNGVNENW